MLSELLDWAFPSRVRDREARAKWRVEHEKFLKRFGEAVHKMADVGVRWLQGEFNEFKTLEEALLSVEPGASGSLYACALAEVKRRRLLERDVLKRD